PGTATLGGGKLRYAGTRVAPLPAHRGRPLTLTHYFETLAPVDREMKMFVHVEDARAPGILVNRDHHPVDGLYPIDRWKAGEVIEDTYTIDVPAAAPDALAVYVGFY